MTHEVPAPGPILSAGQLDALDNLAAKKAGEAVAWINIADAMSLARLGFAVRGRQGWVITPEGAAALELSED